MAEQPQTKLLMLTAARSTDDLVTGSRSAPTTTCAKPFRFAELVARAARAGAPLGRAAPAGPARAGDVVLDPARRDGHAAPAAPLDLTPKEFAVLEAAARRPGRVVTPEELVERAWDEQLDPLSNTVRMTVMTLRRKLGDPPLVETVRGSGYRV